MNVLWPRLIAVAVFLGAASPAFAQTVPEVPPAIWAQVEALGPVVDAVNVGKIYAQLRSQMPTDGVKKTLNISAVAWTRANIAANGGDPNKIVLFGHSAGASHVAAYVFEKRFQPASGSGLAGVILGSGLYDPTLGPLSPGSPPSAADTAYYGADPKAYAARSTALHLDGAKIPTLIFEVEMDPLPMVIENGALYTQLCHRDNQCPVMYRILMHDHISAPTGINTGDESVSTPLLNFIKAR